MNKPDLPPLVLIAGPTASGKSALAMALARTVPATIVNADSMQVYRDLRVLTARPSVDDASHVAHVLFGFIDGGEACSAARWASDAVAAIASIHGAGRTPILVGGTGLYIRSLLDGIAPIPPIDAHVRATVRAMPVDAAYVALEREDAHAAARLSPNDTTRVARALEVVRSTGRAIGDWQGSRSGGIAAFVDLRPMVILPPRDELGQVIDARFEQMFDASHDEVAALVARRLDPMLPVMRAIGVAQVAAYLAGEMTRRDALAAGRLATRQYAKRQATWFARQVPASWPIIARTVSRTSIEELVTKLQ